MGLTAYHVTEIENLRVQGRTVAGKEGIPLFWTGPAVEVNVTGTELWCEYECIGNPRGACIRVEIDGADMIRMPLVEGVQRFCAFTCFGKDEAKNVRILRDMQAGAPALVIRALETDGAFMPLPERHHKIEVIGDSVTSGEGLAGAQCHTLWIPPVFSSRGNYALELAKAIDADYSICSQSGWGFYCAWNNNPNQAMPLYFNEICSVTGDTAQIALGAHKPHDFASDATDITIINLGANDCSAFSRPTVWTDADGVEHSLQLGEDGKPVPGDAKKVIDRIVDFLTNIRAKRPDGITIWCYGMLSDLLNDTMFAAYEQYIAASGDAKTYMLRLPHADASLNGARNHPGPAAHKLYLEAILAKLREIGVC